MIRNDVITHNDDVFREQLPDFRLDDVLDRRNKIKVQLERLDMLRRRTALEIPEFYVGTCSFYD